MKVVKYLSALFDIYSHVVVIMVTIFIVLFIIVGGEFKLTIHWQNVTKLFETIRKIIQS